MDPLGSMDDDGARVPRPRSCQTCRSWGLWDLCLGFYINRLIELEAIALA